MSTYLYPRYLTTPTVSYKLSVVARGCGISHSLPHPLPVWFAGEAHLYCLFLSLFLFPSLSFSQCFSLVQSLFCRDTRRFAGPRGFRTTDGKKCGFRVARAASEPVSVTAILVNTFYIWAYITPIN